MPCLAVYQDMDFHLNFKLRRRGSETPISLKTLWYTTGKDLAAWQGPAIYAWNNRTFSPADFASISKVSRSSS